MSKPGYECMTCNKKFSNRSHLRRHEASHTSQPHHPCEFCGHVYSRSDALRRHYRTCPWIGKQSEPGPSRPGRRRKACDSCAKQRVTCDGLFPCENCQGRPGVACTYERLEGSLGPPPDLALDAPVQTQTQTQPSAGRSDGKNTHKASVPFLLNYSGPGNRHPSDVNRALSLLSTAESGEIVDSALPSFDLEIDGADFTFDEAWNGLFGPFQQNETCQNSALPAGLEDSHQRQMAANNMIDCILRSQERCFTGASGNHRNPALAQDFFSEQRVYEYIKAYFDQIVRPRSRIVLKSTFRLEDTSTPLLLSLFLMGAACDENEEVKSQVVEYAELAEYTVFENSAFRRMTYQREEVHWSLFTKEEIEIIQAAILMALLEIASPKPEARRRTRIQWYPALVSAARASGLTRVRNEWHQNSDTIDHDQFLKNETCIRMMSSIAMMDCHFIMFFNNPPNFTATELVFDLPAEEEGVDIPDGPTWKIWKQNEAKRQRPPPLNQFVQKLLSNDWHGYDDGNFGNLSIFSLYVVISAFFRIIFGLRSSMCDISDAMRQVDRALSRWMELWDRVKEAASAGEIYRAGIMIHARDLGTFAKLLLRTPLSETGEIARDSMARIHELLKSASQ